jgi:N-formylglutamate amidohydrolase
MQQFRWMLVAILILVVETAHADPPKLITIRSGEIPVILSAPHGGYEPIPGVPPRKGTGVPQFAIVRDDNTSELTEMIARELTTRMHAKPYLVIARFDRKYLDVNRPEEAAFESDKAKPYYRAYHQALADFTREAQQKWKHGLLLDIHGQKEFPSALVRGTNNSETVQLLLQRFGREALTGSKSVFGVFAGAGFDVLPANDSDDKEEKRFSGGHIVRSYGSHQVSGIDAIQLEFGSDFRDKARLKKTASVMAEAIEIFCRAYLKEAATKAK